MEIEQKLKPVRNKIKMDFEDIEGGDDVKEETFESSVSKKKEKKNNTRAVHITRPKPKQKQDSVLKNDA